MVQYLKLHKKCCIWRGSAAGPKTFSLASKNSPRPEREDILLFYSFIARGQRGPCQIYIHSVTLLARFENAAIKNHLTERYGNLTPPFQLFSPALVFPPQYKNRQIVKNF